MVGDDTEGHKVWSLIFFAGKLFSSLDDRHEEVGLEVGFGALEDAGDSL